MAKYAVPDPDLGVMGGGGGVVSKKLFRPFRASVWSENKGGRAHRAPPLDPSLNCTVVD